MLPHDDAGGRGDARGAGLSKGAAVHRPDRPGYSWRSACTIGIRAARSAGKKPPTTPISAAKMTPISSRPGVTLNGNATSLKDVQFVVLVVIPLIGVYPIVSAVLSVLFLEERLTGLQVVGIGLAAAAVVLISIGR